MTPIERSLRDRLGPDARAWFDGALTAVTRDPTAIRSLFPAVGRNVGRGPLATDADADAEDYFAWTIDDAARVVLLDKLGEHAVTELWNLYRHGDASERRAVLRALPHLPVGTAGVAVVEDALRTNDLRLIAAAMGPYAAEHLDDDTFAQAVLKCAFVGLPLDRIAGLERRVTPDLSRMLADYVHERVAAGRDAPPDVWPLIEQHPPAEQIAAIESEVDHPTPARSNAARAALAEREAARAGST